VVEELHRTVRRNGHAIIIDQEGVARFETIQGLLEKQGFRFNSEKALSLVYDHGKASRALMLTFMRK
jgi:hypothetical protein